jgi:hypothetical protein
MVTGDLAVAGRQLPPRPSGGRPTARRAAASGYPAPAAAGPRRHAPAPRHTCRTKPSRSRQVRRSPYEDHSHRAGTPRIIQVGPSSIKGTRRSFLTASQKGSSGPALERRSLCRPSGPDGGGQARGQARSARGEPPQRGTYRDARLTARQSTIFYAVDRRLGSWSTVSDYVPGGT